MLAFTRTEALGASDIYVTPLAGGEAKRLTWGNHNTQGLAWAPDGKSLAFSAVRLGGGSPFALWRVAISGGDPSRLAFGEHGRSPSASLNGRLAYVREELRWDIWRVAGPAARSGDRKAAPLISSTAIDYFPRYSPDGREIAFSSSRSGAQEIWICEADGSRPRQLTFQDSPLAAGPFWSPDGRWIAYNSPREGSEDVWVVSRSGGAPRRLTATPHLERAGGWSSDGRWVYLVSNRGGSTEVWRVTADGEAVEQVTTGGGSWPFESSDGRYVYFTRHDGLGGGPGIWRRPVAGGEAERVLEHGLALRWDLLDEGIVYLGEGGEETLSAEARDRTPTLRFFDFGSGTTSDLAPLPNAAPWGISVSPDRRWVLYTAWQPPEGDIILAEGFR